MAYFQQKRWPAAVFHLLVILTLFSWSHPDARQESTGPASVPGPQFDLPDTLRTSSGYFRLLWKPDREEIPENLHFELQQSPDPTFRDKHIRYEGPDLASYVSGLANGSYYFRVRGLDTGSGASSPWSPMLVVEVDHHSLTLAIAMFGLGSIVFIMTAVVVIRGVRRTAVSKI